MRAMTAAVFSKTVESPHVHRQQPHAHANVCSNINQCDTQLDCVLTSRPIHLGQVSIFERHSCTPTTSHYGLHPKVPNHVPMCTTPSYYMPAPQTHYTPQPLPMYTTTAYYICLHPHQIILSLHPNHIPLCTTTSYYAPAAQPRRITCLHANRITL